MNLVLTKGSTMMTLTDVSINYGKAVSNTKHGQKQAILYSGSLFVSDFGGTKTDVELSLRFLTKEQKDLLEGFIITHLNYSMYPFTVELTNRPNTICLDMGRGHSVFKVENVRFNKASTDDMFEVRAPGHYHCVFPYTFKR